MNHERGIDTALRLAGQFSAHAGQALQIKCREVRGAPRCAYDVLVKLAGQPRGRVLFTLIWDRP